MTSDKENAVFAIIFVSKTDSSEGTQPTGLEESGSRMKFL